MGGGGGVSKALLSLCSGADISAGAAKTSDGFFAPHLAQNIPFLFSCPQEGQVHGPNAGGALSVALVGVPHFAQNFAIDGNSLPQCLQIFAI